MMKYDLVLFAGQKDDFLNRLQDLGLVDITVRGWEPDEKERELMVSIDRHRAAVSRLRAMAGEEAVKSAVPYPTGEEAYDEYIKASTAEDNLTAQIAQGRKDLEYLGRWGDFSPEKIAQLESTGVKLRFFHAYTKEFDARFEEWSGEYLVYPVSESDGMTWFVVVTTPGTEVPINAQEDRAPDMTYSDKEAEIEGLIAEREALKATIERAAASVDLIAEHGAAEQELLHLEQVAGSGSEAAEGTLVLLEGWATAETAGKVDAMLAEYPNLFYIKSDPTPEDEPPVVLRNNRFNRMFEIIGGFYSLPRYGTLDLTPFFGPFYVLFFGLCLADAGYGLIFFILGLVMRSRVKPEMRPAVSLVTLCGLSTMICGTFLGSFFGIQLADIEWFGDFRNYILSPDNMFALALGLGVVQILFGMCLKVVNLSRQFGFRYALATLGWIIVLVAGLVSYGLGSMGYEQYGFGSTAFWIAAGIGLFMMFFLNSPGKNPFVNFGAGLWNTYNHITGIIGDVLSYIRLFAIGLSGGILASVFNQLALGLSPDIPVLRQISIILILTIGHGITLFMSTLSAFVHPMRLTFVEFYGNAGFEATQRAFNPLKRNKVRTTA
ncbi:MAG: V-type ATP synthase subunit I [Rikenellaceae bacterium]|nr:V-type ATP synthase subunit I [Rikenellaceae bacterium]